MTAAKSPFATARCGGSPRMEIGHASSSTDATIRPENQSGHPLSSSAPEKSSPCEQRQLTLFSSGDGSSTTADRRASTAPFSETSPRTYRPSLSDRLTPSLITAGLVCGITPLSIRQQCGQPIRALAFGGPVGGDAEKRNAASSFLKGFEK